MDLAALDSLDANARAFDRFTWLEQELSHCTLPALLIWGREDDVFDPNIFIPRFQKLLPHAEGPHLVTGRHFLQENSAPEIAAHIVDFLQTAAMITVIPPPPLDGKRLAFVLVEDRLGHYAEFRTFFGEHI